MCVCVCWPCNVLLFHWQLHSSSVPDKVASQCVCVVIELYVRQYSSNDVLRDMCIRMWLEDWVGGKLFYWSNIHVCMYVCVC